MPILYLSFKTLRYYVILRTIHMNCSIKDQFWLSFFEYIFTLKFQFMNTEQSEHGKESTKISYKNFIRKQPKNFINNHW